MDLATVLAIVGILIMVVTLAATVWGVMVGLKGNKRESEREAPWSLVKLSETSWNLERTNSNRATIVGVEFGPDLCSTADISWHNSAAFPAMIFKRGDSIKFTIQSEESSLKMTLLYREYSNKINSDKIEIDYQGVNHRFIPEGVKEWPKQLF